MATQTPPDAAPKKGKLKTIILLVVVMLLAIGLSVAGTFWFLKQSNSDDTAGTNDETTQSQEVFKPSQYAVLDKALVTTVQAEGRQRYVQVYLAFEADNAEALAATGLHMPLLRSQMIGVLAASDFIGLQTAAGRNTLATELLATVNGVLEQEGEPILTAVLLRNFVLQ